MKSLFNTTVLITGSTDGIGKETAKYFAANGSTVIIHGRNKEKGNAIVEELKEITNNDNIYLAISDYAALAQVKNMAVEIKRKFPQLNLLINNAGVYIQSNDSKERKVSLDNNELHWQINYLAPVTLSTILLPTIIKNSPAKILNVSSLAQQFGNIDFYDINIENNWTGDRAYCQSKLAITAFTYDLAMKLKQYHVMVNCLHPGNIDTKIVWKVAKNWGVKPPEAGAQNIIFLATSEI